MGRGRQEQAEAGKSYGAGRRSAEYVPEQNQEMCVLQLGQLYYSMCPSEITLSLVSDM